jgi:hypothetical protein
VDYTLRLIKHNWVVLAVLHDAHPMPLPSISVVDRDVAIVETDGDPIHTVARAEEDTAVAASPATREDLDNTSSNKTIKNSELTKNSQPSGGRTRINL